ncbi:MAG: hypothetical protein K0S74_125 [Chlamydiales bacterium]|jgi:hypothetical protein|nr:hypothetical protein [Chlamydiales bacterium]
MSRFIPPTFPVNTTSSQNYTYNHFANWNNNVTVPVENAFDWRRNSNTAQVVLPSTTTGQNRFPAGSTINIYTSALWQEFFTNYFPVTNEEYLRNPYDYDDIFGKYLTDYATRYLFGQDNSNPAATGVNAPIAANTGINGTGLSTTRYTNAVTSQASAITTFRHYLDTIWRIDNPGPFGAQVKDSISSSNPIYGTAISAGDYSVYTISKSAPFVNCSRNILLWVIQLILDLKNELQKTLEDRANFVKQGTSIESAINERKNQYTAASASYTTSDAIKQKFDNAAQSMDTALSEQQTVGKQYSRDIDLTNDALSQLTDLISALRDAYANSRDPYLK